MRENKAVLKTSYELIEWLRQYPDTEISVHGNSYFRIEHNPPGELCNKPQIVMVGQNEGVLSVKGPIKNMAQRYMRESTS